MKVEIQIPKIRSYTENPENHRGRGAEKGLSRKGTERGKNAKVEPLSGFHVFGIEPQGSAKNAQPWASQT